MEEGLFGFDFVNSDLDEIYYEEREESIDFELDFLEEEMSKSEQLRYFHLCQIYLGGKPIYLISDDRVIEFFDNGSVKSQIPHDDFKSALEKIVRSWITDSESRKSSKTYTIEIITDKDF